MRERTYLLIAQSFAIGITCFIFVFCFSIVGQKVSFELKWRYMKAILTKDSKWYEETDAKSLPYLVNLNLREVQNATGKSAGFILFSLSIAFNSLIVCFISGILLAACML